ncbi:mitochondrial fission 1 protein [Leptinotarsa decemlineata]|uniref:mitochondrial fission 1 protein n=1 Tax=Leptinotarsa decemlineata TaxID=7539 RepID=UPI000C2530FE|nr:mitochondrial fission 1 protein [Leptinotarsa decemlineata]
MADLLTETVLPEDLKKFEKIYHDQLYKNDVTPKAQFDYAWCLVRSKYPADIQKGIVLFEELYRTHEEGQRDYMYYLAIGNARLKEYNKALNYVRMFLSVEPGNQQVLTLQEMIKKKMEKEGMFGMAVAGGAILAVGAIVGVGMALASKGKS